MKIRLLLLILLFFSFLNVLLAEPPSYIQTKDGVVIFTDPIFNGTSKAVKLEVVSANIIRVIAAPGKEIAAAQSLLTVYAKKTDLSWNVVSTKETITLKTKKLTAIVDLKTGAVSFRDHNGKKILIEKPTGGRNFRSAIFDIYSLAGSAYRDDYTIMRGLVMDFSTDTTALNIGDQYMFGPSSLINPVCEYKQRSRSLYLPKSAGWYDLYSGKWYAGGQKIIADAPYEKMPVFVKAGSVIPFGPSLQFTSEKPADTIMLNIYTGADASFNLYEDEDTNYNYEKGAFSVIPIKYNEAEKTITFYEREGSFKGMLLQKVFRINIIKPGVNNSLKFDEKSDKEILYKGKKIIIKI